MPKRGCSGKTAKRRGSREQFSEPAARTTAVCACDASTSSGLPLLICAFARLVTGAEMANMVTYEWLSRHLPQKVSTCEPGPTSALELDDPRLMTLRILPTPSSEQRRIIGMTWSAPLGRRR